MNKETKNPLSELAATFPMLDRSKQRSKKSKKVRVTITLSEEHNEKLDALAFNGDLYKEEVLAVILNEFFAGKNIPALPKKEKDKVDKLLKKSHSV